MNEFVRLNMAKTSKEFSQEIFDCAMHSLEQAQKLIGRSAGLLSSLMNADHAHAVVIDAFQVVHGAWQTIEVKTKRDQLDLDPAAKRAIEAGKVWTNERND